jgi:hypothetical protein
MSTRPVTPRPARSSSRSRWRTAAFVALGFASSVFPLGLSPGNANATLAPATGYFPFGPQAFGDAANCATLGGGTASTNQPLVGMALTPDCAGYWLASADGGVFSVGNANFYGSAGNLHLNAPVVGMAATPDGKGYWLVGADGGIFSYGDANFYGSTGALHLNAPIVGMAATPDGKGYWLVAADGGVFSYGDATYSGSMGGQPLNAPVVGIVADHDGTGYWLVAADGGIFSYGGAPFYGSTGGIALAAPVTAMAATPDAKGYWLVGADGGVFGYGDAGFYGSLSVEAGNPGGSQGSPVIANPVIALASSPSGQGYLLLPTTPAVNPRIPADTGYALARREWQITAYEAAVYQSATWEQAASYLGMGEGVDPGTTSGYPAAIAELNQLANIPEMDVTPAQSAEASADTSALTSFFSANTAP